MTFISGLWRFLLDFMESQFLEMTHWRKYDTWSFSDTVQNLAWSLAEATGAVSAGGRWQFPVILGGVAC